jgi:transposase-like protein
MAVERLKSCDSVIALSKELNVPRRTLYYFRDQLAAGSIRKRAEPIKSRQEVPETAKERELRRKVDQLKRSLADKTLEADFFRGALQKIAARRQQNTKAGETASTTKSGN